MQKLLFLTLTLCLLSNTARLKGEVIHIPDDQPTIQSGINAALQGDTVLVAPGTYYENIHLKGKNIVLTSHFILNRDYHFIQLTTIDGSRPVHPDSASCVHITSGEDTSCVLQGFTITGGNGTKWQDPCILYPYREGGGILIANASPIIQYNLILDNQAVDTTGVNSAGGGGICCNEASPIICNNIIRNNQGRYGAGMTMNYSSGYVYNNIIARNRGGQDFGGGGLWLYFSNVTIENNTIADNESVLYPPHIAFGSGEGGGMVVWKGTLQFQNNILWNNIQDSPNSIHLINNPTLTVNYCIVQEGWSVVGSKGNLSLDPCFSDETYLLSSSSPGIDAGHPAVTYFDPVDSQHPDSAAYPSRGGLRNDMGAYGGPHRCEFYSLLSTEVRERNPFPVSCRLAQNFPNPFNPETVIEYELSQNTFVDLSVYNILGGRVKTLVHEEQKTGPYKILFDGSSLENGIYFYTLKTQNSVKTRKMILIK